MSSKIKQQIFEAISTNPVLRWISNAFMISGLLILGYACYVLFDTQLYQADQAREFERIKKGANLSRADNSSLASREGSLLGRIEIGQIGLSAMIQEGTSEQTLQRAVGHIPGTSLPGHRGNVAIAGHRDTFFRGLRKIHLGDEIMLTTLRGSYRYRVESTKVVEPEDVQVLDADTDDILTLVTCYPFSFVGSAPQRFIVRARRITA